MTWFVYILRVNGGSLYTGITNNLEKRLKAHSDGKGSKYVRAHLPFELVYVESVKNKSLALKREIQIKKLTKIQKEEIIRRNNG